MNAENPEAPGEKTDKKENKDQSNLLRYDDDERQSVVRFFGIELTAPVGLKNPRIVYISFIVVNLLLVIVLKSFIS